MRSANREKQKEWERERERSHSSTIITSRLGIARGAARQQQAHADRREHNDRSGGAGRDEARRRTDLPLEREARQKHWHPRRGGSPHRGGVHPRRKVDR